MDAYVDLHLHTVYSDGAWTPAEVAAQAAAKGFAAIAVTDHDAVGGVAEAAAAAQAEGLEFLAGVELSTRAGRNELHVVGLGVDPAAPALAAALERAQEIRAQRIERIGARLAAAGIPLDVAAIMGQAGAGMSLGRMHIALALHKAGAAGSVQEAFDKYLKQGRPAHVAKPLPPVRQAVDTIHAAGGLAFLAHPGIGRETHRRLAALMTLPFDGIEVYHSKHTPGRTQAYLALAEEHGWLVSGGSDCHGDVKGRAPELGKVRVPYRHFERIRAALAARRGRVSPRLP